MQSAKQGILKKRTARFGSGLALLVGLIVVGVSSRAATTGQLARVKDVASIEGIRDNQLVGYGLVVGLHGTGDSSQTVFPAQTLLWPVNRIDLKEGATVEDLVQELQRTGAGARDVISILQAMKQAGALEADLEVL